MFARVPRTLAPGWLLAIAAWCALASVAASQAPAPTLDNLAWATVPLDDGGTASLHLDFWRSPSGAEHAPLVVWIHGGAWLAGSYNDPPPGLAGLLNEGYAVASVQYRLSGSAIFPAQIHDVKGAVRFLRAHADEYGLDPSRFVAYGSSAGGHLAALLATSGGVAELEGETGGHLEQASTVQAAIDYFGPTDILHMNDDVTNPPGSIINHDAASSPESQLIGFGGAGQGIGVLRANLDNPAAPYPEKAALAARANPIEFVDADDPPMFIAHGTLDNLVPQKQSQRLTDALTAAGVDHAFRIVVGAGHGFGNQTGAVNEEALAFLAQHVRQPAGDFDRSGAVDGADFLEWQRQLGSSVLLAGSAADGDVDGHVTASDLAVWRQRFGATGPALATAAVWPTPEPLSALPLAAAVAATAMTRKRRRARRG